jgi:hypothetical protein
VQIIHVQVPWVVVGDPERRRDSHHLNNLWMCSGGNGFTMELLKWYKMEFEVELVCPNM